mmetsp:Transcript_148257/g.261563  ORF Transcript_148257/g.261563 Transcript_148257/m.261563 type:complete len:477 (-) Transcript_148257:263-1693(-)
MAEGQGGGEGLFEKLDANNDGVISRQEFDSAMRSGMLQEASSPPAALTQDVSQNSGSGDWLKGMVSEVSNSTRSTDCPPAAPSESDGVWCLSRGSTGPPSEGSEEKAICDLVACEISRGMVLEANVSREMYQMEYSQAPEVEATSQMDSAAARPVDPIQKPQMCESRCSDVSEANVSIKGIRSMCQTPSEVGGYMQDFARGLLTDETVNVICNKISAANAGGGSNLDQADLDRQGAISRQSNLTATDSVLSYATPGGLAVIEEEEREVFRNVSEEEVRKMAAGLVPFFDNGQESVDPSSPLGSAINEKMKNSTRPVTGSTAYTHGDLSGTMTTFGSQSSPTKDAFFQQSIDTGMVQQMADLRLLASTPSEQGCSVMSYSVLGDAPTEERKERETLHFYNEISKELAQELLPQSLRGGVRTDCVHEQDRGFTEQEMDQTVSPARQQALAVLAKGEEAERVAREVAADTAIFLAVERK